jgi:release factor glutamine methyltransferase
MLNIRAALAQGTQLLGGSRLTAEVLLGQAMGRDRAYFYAHPEQELREVEWLHYGRYLHERMQGKPTQYITHKQEFYGRDFRVTPEVLIPRPETELLVETVLKLRAEAGRTVDVGAGSGAIAVTLVLEWGREVVATDVSGGALRVAAGNAARLGAPVRFVQTDLVAALASESMDVVVSNPPYVAEADRDSLSADVRDWEPSLALFGGADGLAVYERLVPEAWRVLKSGGLLALEIGFGQAIAVSRLVDGWRDVRVFPDLAGIPRVIVCEKP